MNTAFLILVAAPLGVYLIALIMATRDLGAGETADETGAPVAMELPAAESAQEAEFEAVHTVAPVQELTSNEPLTGLQSDAGTVAASTWDLESDAVPFALETTAAENENPLTDAPTLLEVAPTQTPAQSETTVEKNETPVTAESETILPESASSVTSQPDDETLEPDQEPLGPLEFPSKGSPKYAFDYRGRLWVEKKRKSFFRQLRRPQIPPEEPG